MPTGRTGTKAAINNAYTGKRAEHVMNGAARIVAIRSRRLGITRVAMIAGTAHAKLDSNGITDCPDKPTARMARSTR